MKIGDFYGKIKSDELFASKSRLLIVRNRLEQKELRQLFAERPQSYEWVRFSQCVDAKSFVPPADRVMERIKVEIRRVNAAGHFAYATGLSALLALWDNSEKRAAFEQIKMMLDDASLKFWIFTNGYRDEAQMVFSNPRYTEGQAIMVVGEKPDEDRNTEVRLVSAVLGKAMNDGVLCSSISDYIAEYEIGGFPGRPMNITITDYHRELAGINGGVRQIFRDGDFLRAFCNYSGGLSESAERWLLEKMMDAGKRMPAKDFVQEFFFQDNLTEVCRDAPRMILKCTGEEQEALVWMLRLSIQQDKYLSRVLADERFACDQFKLYYVNKAAELIEDVDAAKLCEERRAGIAAILHDDVGGLDTEIAEFVRHTKECDPYRIIPWLTNRTKVEKHECVRRLRQANLKTLPTFFFDAFPQLEHYLAPYALGDSGLEEYFTKYRELKIKNTVDQSFCDQAKSIAFPIVGIKSRDDALMELAMDGEAGLLVVDAMGLEYMPLLLSMAKRNGLGVANAIPVSVRIPTSTKFNPIAWPQERKAGNIPDLDVIIHNGAHVHGESTDEENFAALLEVFSSVVMPKISHALFKYKRLVLTADHGASRLAVLANNLRLAQTLPVQGVDASAADWRYVAADTKVVPPQTVASNVAGDYWVARGYDRFSKQGGKRNELHGGLTYEEVLVPLMVFEKGAMFEPKPSIAPMADQMVENEEFDL